MDYLFKETITPGNWGNIFQNIGSFRKLIYSIFLNEGLGTPESITNLTPGTNAVFKVDNYVIKLFAPVESGFSTIQDYQVELESLNWMKNCGVKCPNVIKSNVVSDRYIFYYIIMEYIQGTEIGKLIKKLNETEKIQLSKKIKSITKKMNHKLDSSVLEKNIITRVFLNKKWNQYNETVRKQLSEIVVNIDLKEIVYVHGDLTSENILIDKDNKLFVIDFADSLLAPAYYEYPPLLFDLFDFDLIMIQEYLDNVNRCTIDDIFYSLLIHEYGPDYIKLIYEHLANKNIKHLNDIYEVKQLISVYLFEIN